MYPFRAHRSKAQRPAACGKKTQKRKPGIKNGAFPAENGAGIDLNGNIALRQQRKHLFGGCLIAQIFFVKARVRLIEFCAQIKMPDHIGADPVRQSGKRAVIGAAISIPIPAEMLLHRFARNGGRIIDNAALLPEKQSVHGSDHIIIAGKVRHGFAVRLRAAPKCNAVAVKRLQPRDFCTIRHFVFGRHMPCVRIRDGGMGGKADVFRAGRKRCQKHLLRALPAVAKGRMHMIIPKARKNLHILPCNHLFCSFF